MQRNIWCYSRGVRKRPFQRPPTCAIHLLTAQTELISELDGDRFFKRALTKNGYTYYVWSQKQTQLTFKSKPYPMSAIGQIHIVRTSFGGILTQVTCIGNILFSFNFFLSKFQANQRRYIDPSCMTATVTTVVRDGPHAPPRRTRSTPTLHTTSSLQYSHLPAFKTLILTLLQLETRFWGQKLLGLCIGRGLGAPKGVKSTPRFKEDIFSWSRVPRRDITPGGVAVLHHGTRPKLP